MAMNRRIGKLPPENYRREEATVRLDTGPYIGKIMNNLDPTRSGRLQVHIPDLGSGDDANPSNWRTVAYASPFMGTTHQPDSNKQNAFRKVQHTYGMWAVPPDLGNLVICTFIAGDPNRGFWFACVTSQLGHHMLPGIAGSSNVDASQISDPTVKEAYKGKPTVVAEFNENDETADWTNFANLKKPIHEEQYKVYLRQGLEEDYVRGILSGTSQRESPSYVFGISTPGRPINDPADDPEFNEKMKSGQFNPLDYAVASRKGGHTVLLDDGNIQGKDQLIRLRTAGGHQILMNDSERVLYIGNSEGSVWIELTGAGHLNIYSGNSVNIRAEGELNFHADKNINLNAGGDVKISAGKSMQLQSQTMSLNTVQDLTAFGGTKTNIGSSGSLNLNAAGTTNVLGSSGVRITGSKVTLNDGFTGDATFNKPAPLKFNKLSDAGQVGNKEQKIKKWVSVDGALTSIVTIAPTHEPWGLHQPTALTGENNASQGVVNASSIGGFTGTGNGVTSGPAPGKDLPVVECKGGVESTDAGPKSAKGIGVHNPVNKSYLSRSDNPDVSGGVGTLTASQTKALITQVAWNESGYKYTAENQYSYIGKYQTGAAVLVDQGYIKRDAYSLAGNKSVNQPNSWTGKDGVNSKADYLSNGAVQEKVMVNLLKSNYRTLIAIGGIKDGDDQCTIAGMLAASHLIGAGGAKKWRETAGGQDANGTTGATYFNMGRYAVDVLAAVITPPTTQA